MGRMATTWSHSLHLSATPANGHCEWPHWWLCMLLMKTDYTFLGGYCFLLWYGPMSWAWHLYHIVPGVAEKQSGYQFIEHNSPAFRPWLLAFWSYRFPALCYKGDCQSNSSYERCCSWRHSTLKIAYILWYTHVGVHGWYFWCYNAHSIDLSQRRCCGNIAGKRCSLISIANSIVEIRQS